MSSEPAAGERDILTVQEAADHLHVKVSWIYARVEGVNDLNLPVHRVGRQLRFRRGELDTWFDAQP